jgi:ribosomal protein S21
MFKKAIHETGILAEIKKELNCEKLSLCRLWLKKTRHGYLYWVHIKVTEVGN